jgi:hypothetical protein
MQSYFLLQLQHGAGKDSLVIKLNMQNPEKKYIELNMDIFRHYFLKFIDDVNDLNDKTFARQTNEFAYEIYMTIQEIILSEFPGTNIIITGTLRETDWVEETFRKYKANEFTNYSIKLISLAVPKKESAISVIKRYVSIVDTQRHAKDFLPGTARYTTLGYHDETYEKFPNSLKYFEDMTFDIDENNHRILKPESVRLIDSMEVYKRSKVMGDFSEDTLVYSSENSKYDNTTATKTVERIREMEPVVPHQEIMELLAMINKNKDYFKNQGILRELVIDMANFLNYSHIVEKLQVPVENDNNEEPSL